MSGQQEALRLADEYEYEGFVGKHQFAREEWCRKAALELRRLHAENASLSTGYDAARLEIKSLQAELVKESARTAAEKLRADQMTAQHRMQCEMGKSDRAKVQELKALLAAVGAGGVEPLRKSPVTGVEFSQFLSDVMTAAGLVEHGKQCKALATRLGDTVMRLRVEPPPKADHLRDATQMVPSDHLRGATKMTLDEAIEHADEVAGCAAQCGVEHAQLAAWLRELRDRRVNAASSQPPVAKQPAQAAQGVEKTNAILQSHEITNSDAYFKARPQIDGLDRRNVFRTGFERGWAAAQAPKGGA